MLEGFCGVQPNVNANVDEGLTRCIRWNLPTGRRGRTRHSTGSVRRPRSELTIGDTLSAAEALEVGIVSHVYPDEQLLEQALTLANRIAANSPIAVSMIKRAVYQSSRIDLRTSLDLISSHMGIVQSTEDYQEAMSALRNHRVPLFRNS